MPLFGIESNISAIIENYFSGKFHFEITYYRTNIICMYFIVHENTAQIIQN